MAARGQKAEAVNPLIDVLNWAPASVNPIDNKLHVPV